MLKRFIRWMLPLMVLALIATYLLMSHMVSIHAAGPSSSHIHGPSIHMIAPQFVLPKYLRHR